MAGPFACTDIWDFGTESRLAAEALPRALCRCWPYLLSEMWTGPWMGLQGSALRAHEQSCSPGLLSLIPGSECETVCESVPAGVLLHLGVLGQNRSHQASLWTLILWTLARLTAQCFWCLLRTESHCPSFWAAAAPVLDRSDPRRFHV